MNDISWHLSGKALIKEINTMVPPKGRIAIWPLGQCGFVLKYGKSAIGIDLVLSELYDKDGNRRRLFAPPFSPDAGLELTALAITHNHRDHLDIPTVSGLQQTNPGISIILPKGIEDEVRHSFYREEGVCYLADDASITAGNFTLRAIPVAHEEYIRKNGNSISMGYAITYDEQRLFHSGDALADKGLSYYLRSFHPGLVFLPINGRDDERHSRGIIGCMSAEEAIALAKSIDALLIPMHYDFFSNNGYDIMQYKQEAEREQIRTIIPELGKIIIW